MRSTRILFLAPAQTVTRVFPHLKEAGIEVGIAENVKGASAFIRKGVPALILSRPFLPAYQVEDLLQVGSDDPHFPPVIVFTEKVNLDEAERLLELGAFDYWAEPLSHEKILAAVPSECGPSLPAPPSSILGGRKGSNASAYPQIVGSDQSMRRVLALAKQVAHSKATVLIYGESGTGKEMFSRFLHQYSGRKEKPFVAVNCSALPEHLLESELFGHEKGAFTGAIARKLGRFELASGGTLLLDEISEMDISLQAKLLRVLQEGEIDRVGGTETLKVDVRVLATTNRNLEEWVETGKFRQDLYFRLNVIPLRLPSLRERGDDILALADYFIDLYSRDYQLPSAGLSGEAREWLMGYAWPGNVRELQNLMERSVLLSGGRPIEPAHFLLSPDEWPLFLEEDPSVEAEIDSALEKDGLEAFLPEKGGADCFKGGVIPLHEMERIMIQKGLVQTGGNRTQAAELLGISVRTLRNKLNEYRASGFAIEDA